jgi:hypothetical protein
VNGCIVFYRLPRELFAGGSSSMAIPIMHQMEERLSDDEEMHRHKGGFGSKLTAEAK